MLVLATVGLLAALALAAAARFAIGAIEIRVQPGVTPSASLPPVTPGALGDPVPAEEAVALAGFEPSLPSGPAPDEVYVIDSPFGDPGLLYAWRPSATYPALPGTEWGLVLIAFQGDDETVVKSVQAFEDVHDASVDGARAVWIPVPHVLTIDTERRHEDLLGPRQRPDLGGGRHHLPARDLARPGVGARGRPIDGLRPPSGGTGPASAV